ncbi:MAG TPA: phenylalanine--tRNA ligase subunit beta, partial [Candidatus Kapabacteria bacterium]|nr:phenylalanine--tRNA ligase subunit beta [Candidatus Kapabacteria bacterium]
MKISLNWLSEYVDIQFTPKELDHRLTMLGIEVEGIEDFASKFDKIVVGEVLEVTPHPNADKLRLTRVSTGNGEPLRIVCGAPNVRQGMKVAVATIGADLGEGFVIKKSKIRGEVSEGMLCSERELGLSEEHAGIWELPSDLAVGVPLAQAIGKQDVIMEIGITPNRADCLSHIGIAREVAAITEQEVRYPKVISSSNGGEVAKLAKVTIADPDLCPRYAARMVRSVKIGPSPEWLRQRVESIGFRSINNVVDVTNFVLMELGHPLHAFDFDQIADAHIIVRRAEGFASDFVTLDGKTRKLSGEMLLISDAKRPLAIAGVMGGQNSEISESTTNVFIESAYFTPSSIRRTAKNLGLSTDASYRFERGTDPNVVLLAVDRAAELIQQVAGGEIVDGVIDEYPQAIEARRFTFRPQRANALLGTQIPPIEMHKVLDKLGIKIDGANADEWILEAPTYRHDLAIEEDAIEEVARVIGYDELPTSEHEPASLPMKNEPLSRREFDILVRSTLLALGFNEALSTPLVSNKEAEAFGQKPVVLINPLNVEMDRMRPSLAINLLDAARRNERFGQHGQRMFEIGSVFAYSDEAQLLGKVKEGWQLGIMLSGVQEAKSPYNTAETKADIYLLGSVVNHLAKRLGLSSAQLTPLAESGTFESGNALVLKAGSTTLGTLGKVNASLAKQYDLR